MIDRRDLLRGTLLGAGASIFSTKVLAAVSRGLEAAPVYPGHQVLFVFLRGGNDGVNTVIPAGDPTYFTARPTLGVLPADQRAINGAPFARLNKEIERLMPIDQAGRLAFLHQVGDPVASRSHFTAMDTFETGADASVTLGALQARTGFVPRILENASIPNLNPQAMPAAMSISGGMQRMFRTDRVPHLTSHVRNLGDVAFLAGVSNAQMQGPLTSHATAHAGPPPGLGAVDGLLAENLKYGLATQAKLLSLGFTPQFATTRLFPLTAPQLATMAGSGAIRVPTFDPKGAGFLAAAEQALFAFNAEPDLRIAGIEFGGWDTHGEQLLEHPNLLRYLAWGLADMDTYIQTQGLGNRITVVVVSEFGRTNRENWASSTDHGVGGLYVVLGENVRPGTYNARGTTVGPNEYGALWPNLTSTPTNPAYLDATPVATDFRLVLAEICDKCFGITGAGLNGPNGVVPNFPLTPYLNFLV